MTAEEFLRVPEPLLDGCELISGVVWREDRDEGLPDGSRTLSSRPHSVCEASTAAALVPWMREHLPGGAVASGEAAVQLPDRRTRLGVDVVAFDAATVAAQPPPPGEGEGMFVWHGVPRLVVEIMSDSDRSGDVTAKVRESLAAGVPRVWVADPRLATLTVHRPDGPPDIFQGKQAIENDPALPGLSVRAGDLFPD